MVSYDIRDDKRRLKVFKTLKNFGQRCQFSVFECNLKKIDYLKLRERLRQVVRSDEGDSIRFYFLCEADANRVERIGGITPWPEDVMII